MTSVRLSSFRLSLGSRTGLVAAATLLLTACAPGQDTPTPTASLDLRQYLAVGDSYTAGLSAGGLTRASQEYSFPNLLAQQFRTVSTEVAFSQPLLEAGNGSDYLELVDFPANGFLRTRRVAGQTRRLLIDPNACGGPDTLRLLARSATASALPQNLGIPGLRLSQIERAGLGNEATAAPGTPFNPYFERLLPAADNRTYLQAVTTAAATATFFTYFQGLDDVMPYVRSGGECGIATSALTRQLNTNAKKILDVLTAGGRPGIIAQLPALASLPILNQGLLLQARLQAQLGDNNLIYIEDPIPTGQAVPITGADFVLSSALPRIGQLTPVLVGGATLMLPYGRDARNPLRDADVLDGTDEYNRIQQVVTDYNTELDRLARAVYRLPALDSKNTLVLQEILFSSLNTSIAVGGVVYSAEPVRGNFYSLDYYSLTPRGNGLLANAFITAINKAYRCAIPLIDVNRLPTVAQ